MEQSKVEGGMWMWRNQRRMMETAIEDERHEALKNKNNRVKHE